MITSSIYVRKYTPGQLLSICSKELGGTNTLYRYMGSLTISITCYTTWLQ